MHVYLCMCITRLEICSICYLEYSSVVKTCNTKCTSMFNYVTLLLLTFFLRLLWACFRFINYRVYFYFVVCSCLMSSESQVRCMVASGVKYMGYWEVCQESALPWPTQPLRMIDTGVTNANYPNHKNNSFAHKIPSVTILTNQKLVYIWAKWLSICLLFSSSWFCTHDNFRMRRWHSKTSFWLSPFLPAGSACCHSALLL